MNAVSIIGVASAFGLVFLWLLALCAEKGVHPLGRVRQGFRRLPMWERTLILIFLSVWIAFAGTKDGTNGVDQVEGETNAVTQVEGGTNVLGGAVQGRARSPSAPQGAANGESNGQALRRVQRTRPTGMTPITDDDIAQMWRIGATVDGNAIAAPTVNAVTNAAWSDYGGMSDTFRLLPEGWRFPFGAKTTAGLTVFESGEFRPNVKTHFFPSPFDAELSLLPRLNWGLLPNGGESVFWHEQTPSNSLVLTWHNALYGRDVNSPTNFQAELFADGRFDYRYPDRTVQYAPVFPFDWDGDGLENSVDPEPLVAGPDAHGTNAEWFNNVCSNVFTAMGNADGGVELAPRSTLVNTNAYYFVDVVAVDGPAPIYFNGSQPGRLGSPVVIACAGETNHVPLLIGVEYAITSPAPFTVSVPTNGFAEVWANNGYSSNYMVKWPLEFTFTEGFSESSRTYTVDVEPYDPGGTFSWGGASLQNAPLPSGGGEDSCNCVSGVGNSLIFGCSSTCTCGGHCRARGWYRFELLSFAVEGGACRCGFDDPSPFEIPAFNPLDGPSVTVAFSAPAVIFEDAYVDRIGVSQPRRSTRTRLTVSAWGGPNGGTLDLTSQNLDKLSPVACGPMVLPSQITLAPNQSWSISFLCEGSEESVAEKDIVVTGVFTGTGSNAIVTDTATLTSLRVDMIAYYEAPKQRSPHRHDYGIGERLFLYYHPLITQVYVVLNDGRMQSFGNLFDITWGVCKTNHYLRIALDGVVYSPLIRVLEPEGIEGFEQQCVTNGELEAGIAGGVELLQQYRVHPLTVSFEGIAIEEVPCDEIIPPDEYFRMLIQDSFFTNRIQLSHTRAAKAGVWVDVVSGNVGGGYNGKAWDHAGYLGEFPRMMPDGTLTTNTAFGWLGGGSLEWKIPFGWEQKPHIELSEPVGRFAENTRQIFTITADGDVRIHKLGHVAERKLDGTSRLYDQTGTGGIVDR